MNLWTMGSNGWRNRRRSKAGLVVPELSFWLRHTSLILVIGALFTVATAIIAVFVLPNWNVLVGVFDEDGARQAARADARDSGLAISGAIGVATAGLLTLGRVELSRHEHALAKQSERNSRFAHAVELLGHTSATVRSGALHALAGLAEDDHQRQTVINIVCSFARGNVPAHTFHPAGESGQQRENDVPAAAAPDYESALDIALGVPPSWNLRIDLSRTVMRSRVFSDMSQVSFAEAHLIGCRFSSTRIDESSFADATLTGCYFDDAQLTNCNLSRAKLNGCEGVRMANCDLTGATLLGATGPASNFESCDFRSATLNGSFRASTLCQCSFDGSTFVGPDFRDAVVEGCDLSGVRGNLIGQFDGMIERGANKWPSGGRHELGE